MTDFEKKVLGVVATIPLGQVRSYRWVAEQVGRPRAYRAVANALAGVDAFADSDRRANCSARRRLSSFGSRNQSTTAFKVASSSGDGSGRQVSHAQRQPHQMASALVSQRARKATASR